MYTALAKLTALAEQSPAADKSQINELVREILADDDQYITAAEVSELPNGPSLPTLARWRGRKIGPSYVKDVRGRVLYRKGDFRTGASAMKANIERDT